MSDCLSVCPTVGDGNALDVRGNRVTVLQEEVSLFVCVFFPGLLQGRTLRESRD